MTFRSAAFVLGLSLTACSGDDEPSDEEDTDEAETEPTGDTGSGPQEEDLTGLTGSIVLVASGEDQYNDQQYFGYGTFPETDGGILNLAYCITGAAPCLTAIPASGDAAASADGSFIFSEDSFDPGELVVDGTRIPLNSTSPSARYFDWFTGNLGGWGTTGSFSLDGDLAPYNGTDDFTYVTELVVTSPDPTETLLVDEDDVITFTWEPGTEGTMLLEFANTALTLDDDGSYDLAIASLDLEETIDVRLIKLARVNTTEVDAAGNAVQVHTRSEQAFLLSYLETSGRTELVVGANVEEECDDADTLDPLAPGLYWGDLSESDDDHDLDYSNDLTGFPSPGNDVVARIDLLAGQELTVTYATYLDASVYLLSGDCDDDDPIDGADSEYYLEAEDFDYEADEDETVYLVLDSFFEGGWYYWLDVEIDGP
jgi:hypothetical protein